MAEPRQPQHQPHPPSKPDPRDDPKNQAEQDPNRPREGAPVGQMPGGISNRGGPTTGQSGGPMTGSGQQGSMAMATCPADVTQLTESQRQAVQAAGLDWSKLQSINWAQLFQILQAFISLFKQAPPIPAPFMMRHSGSADQNASDEEHYREFAKQHFEAISALAECGQKCCRPK